MIHAYPHITVNFFRSPVRFSFIKETSGDQTVCCVSRGVWLLKPDSDKLELCAFHPHVDSFTEIVLKPSSKIRTFACIKKESITIISADLGTLSWLETQNVGKVMALKMPWQFQPRLVL